MIVPNAPPAVIDELPPDQKPAGDNVQWIPGYWGWDDEVKDYLWVSGFWRVPPPKRQWVPAALAANSGRLAVDGGLLGDEWFAAGELFARAAAVRGHRRFHTRAQRQ